MNNFDKIAKILEHLFGKSKDAYHKAYGSKILAVFLLNKQAAAPIAPKNIKADLHQ